jgi:hypothetical protein
VRARRDLLALVALLALAGCASDGSGASRSSTSTTVDAAAPWSRPCHETTGRAAGDDLGSATFGPLGAEPSVVVHLPLARQDPAIASHYEADRFPAVSWARVHGATVVAAGPPYTSDAATSMVTAVGDDGSVRWTRCLDGTVTDVGGGDGGDLVVVATLPGPGNQAFTDDGEMLLLDAADGTERGRLDRIDDVYATSATAALVGRTDTDSSTPAVLALVDLTSGGRADLAPPPATDAVPTFAVDDDGTVHADRSIWRGGAWVADPDPPTVVDYDWSSNDPQRLVARDGDAVRWQLPLRNPMVEGTVVVQGHDVAAVWTCGEPTDPGAGGRCPISLVGVDVATGTIRWTRPGEQYLGVGGDGAFLALEGDAWTMRRLADGTEIPGQRWADREAFLQGCCDEGRYRNVGRVGGTVVAVYGTDVHVWFPKATSHPTVDVQP